MELYQLKTFVTVAKTCNVTRAAEQLFTTPPSVSNHIRQIEETLDITLFTRTPKGMFITSQGKKLLDQAKEILSAADRFEHLAKSLKNGVSGSVNLAINSTPEYLRIPRIIDRLLNRHPGIKLEIIPSSTGLILNDIENNRLDCGFAFGDLKSNGFSSITLSKVDLVIAIPMKFGVDPNINLEDLAALPWVVPENLCPLLDVVRRFLTSKGIELKNKRFANDDITKFALVQKGTAVCVMEKSEARPFIDKGIMTAWAGSQNFHTRLSFVYASQKKQDHLIRTIIRVVEEIWQTPHKSPVPADE